MSVALRNAFGLDGNAGARALNFNAQNDRLTRNTNLPGATFTVKAYFRFTSTTNYRHIFSLDNGSTVWWQLGFDTGTSNLRFFNNGGTDVTIGTGLTSGRWYCVVLTVAAAGCRWTLKDLSTGTVTTNTGAASTVSGATAFYWGGSGFAGEFFVGDLAGATIWDASLDATQQATEVGGAFVGPQRLTNVNSWFRFESDATKLDDENGTRDLSTVASGSWPEVPGPQQHGVLRTNTIGVNGTPARVQALAVSGVAVTPGDVAISPPSAMLLVQGYRADVALPEAQTLSPHSASFRTGAGAVALGMFVSPSAYATQFQAYPMGFNTQVLPPAALLSIRGHGVALSEGEAEQTPLTRSYGRLRRLRRNETG